MELLRPHRDSWIPTSIHCRTFLRGRSSSGSQLISSTMGRNALGDSFYIVYKAKPAFSSPSSILSFTEFQEKQMPCSSASDLLSHFSDRWFPQTHDEKHKLYKNLLEPTSALSIKSSNAAEHLPHRNFTPVGTRSNDQLKPLNSTRALIPD